MPSPAHPSPNLPQKPAAMDRKIKLAPVPYLDLQTKFLIGTAMILLVCCLTGASVIYFHEKRQLENEAYAKSELVMAAVDASRAYVREELRPIMFALLGDDHFVREAMSTSYVGRAVMDRFSPSLPDLEYRRTSINARNPKYEANPTELDMIEYFRENPQASEWLGIVDAESQPEFRRFKPVIFEAECLQCHGDPAYAPRELRNMYGDQGGFGRTAGELAGVISVGMPVDAALRQVRGRAVTIFVVAFAASLCIFLALGLLFNRMVVSSLRGLLHSFQDVTGQHQPGPGRDELGLLGVSFNTMLRELHSSRQQMQQWNLALETEVNRVRLELEKTQEKLIYNEKMAALGRMTANITHAIRNPLTAAGGFARRLTDVAHGDRERQYASIILAELHRLEKILKEVLILSQDKPLSRTDQALDAVVQTALERHQPRFNDQGVRMQADFSKDLPDIFLDTEQLDIVLDNLLENALDAMPQGGRLTIATEVQEREGRKWAALCITDNGPGMPDAVMEVLFEPFTTSKDLGTGLGLPICKKIIEDHGGKLLVSSPPDQGTTIHIFLPLNQESGV
ncbi:MAG: DUF3365 domain-containing protein [Desulfovibrionales bacterium]|nr:MAG: DUF3365 domain-containing protein [Desulfovibrionales bacterium]